MMKRFKYLLLVMLTSSMVSATVDFLSVNHYTKEYHWGDEDRGTGWIGWEVIPDGIMTETQEQLVIEGYTETHFPFKIEVGLVVLIALFSTLLIKKLPGYFKALKNHEP